MDIGEQERVIIVEPLEAPDPIEPDLVPVEPETEPEPIEEPAKQGHDASRTGIRTIS